MLLAKSEKIRLCFSNNRSSFAPHDGSSPFNAKAAVALLKEAKTQGINFDLNNLLSKLPNKAKENLNKED